MSIRKCFHVYNSCLAVKLDPNDKVNASNFERLKLLGTGAYGRVYLVRKKDGIDKGKLYAMKVLEKFKVTQKKKTTEHTRTEREVSSNSATTSSNVLKIIF